MMRTAALLPSFHPHDCQLLVAGCGQMPEEESREHRSIDQMKRP
jgi:hypothetical protein